MMFLLDFSVFNDFGGSDLAWTPFSVCVFPPLKTSQTSSLRDATSMTQCGDSASEMSDRRL